MTTANTTDEVTRLQIMDPDLPLLASKAAIELDNAIAGRPADLEPVKRLASLLRDSIGQADTPGSLKSLMDPPTVTALGRALRESGGTGSITTVDQLFAKSREIADRLTDTRSGTDKDHLRWAREFFVALARGAVAHRHSARSRRRTHPARR